MDREALSDELQAKSEATVSTKDSERREFEGVDQEMLEFFNNMDSDVEFREFERWLIWI